MKNPDDQKILLILDVDETLIHASDKPLDREFDFKIGPYYVYKRPFLNEFLFSVAADFKLAIWSSASDDYVLEAAKNLVPSEIKLEFVWGRTRCNYRSNISRNNIEYRIQNDAEHYHYVKPLKKLKRKGYDMEQMLIVDDTPHKCQDNYGNAIYPNEFKGDPEDKELYFLSHYLKTLKDVKNVRSIEKRAWLSKTINKLK